MIKAFGCILFFFSVLTVSVTVKSEKNKQLDTVYETLLFTEFLAEMIIKNRMNTDSVIELARSEYIFLKNRDITSVNLGIIIQNLLNTGSVNYKKSYDVICRSNYDNAVSECNILTDMLKKYYLKEKEKYEKEKKGIVLIPVFTSLGIILMLI